MTDLHRNILILVSVSLLTILNAHGFPGHKHFFPTDLSLYNCPTDSLDIVIQSETTCATTPIELQANLTTTNLTWDYGDGTTNNGLANGHATHVYIAAGDYTIRVTADHGEGCEETFVLPIRVKNSKVDFDYQVVNNTVFLTTQPTEYTSVTKYLWTLGDGATASGLTDTFEYTYRNPGTYMVTLVGEGDCSADPVTKTIIVGTPPSPENTPASCMDGIDNDGDGFVDCEDTECECICTSGTFGCCDDFTAEVKKTPATLGLANGSIEIIPSGGSGKTEFYEVLWGEISTDAPFSADQVSAGMYMIELIDKAYGCTLQLPIEIEENNCTVDAIAATIDITTINCAGTNGKAQALVTSDNGPYTYLWSNGSTTSESLDLPEGSHSVTITDAIGCSTIKSFELTSDGDPVQALFTYQITADSIVFTDASSGPIINHQWTFNTPTPIIDNRVSLPPSGIYTICLLTENACGGKDEQCKNISIAPICAEGALQIEIANPQDRYCTREPILFTTDVVAEKYSWFFGELNDFTGEEVRATGPNLQSITQVYFQFGTPTIKLVVDYGDNCIDSTSMEITISSSEADFTYSLEKNTATFIADSIESITTYSWTIQGPTTTFNGEGRILQYELTEIGEYTVGLLTMGNCNSIIKQKIIPINGLILSENSPALCSDGIDNDGDGLLDCEDMDCDCPICPTDLALTNQLQVDNFPISYPECTTIPGNVTIQSIDGTINNLTALQQITEIGGDLVIVENPMLTSLAGLDNLADIGGDIEVDQNPLVPTLAPLSNIISVEGSLAIGEMNGLTELLGDASALTTIGMDLLLFGNTQLKDLSSLENIVSIGGTLEIANQSTISSLNGINNLNTIGGSILLSDNSQLADLSALHDLSTIDGEILISNNPTLSSLTGLEQLDPSGISKVTIQSSAALTTCNINSICTFLENGGVTKIAGNAVGCTSAEEIQSLCNPTPPPSTNTLFIDYPWLLSLIDTMDCEGISLQEFTSTFDQKFIYIKEGSGTLYNEEGRLWCTSTPTFDCLTFYTVVENERSWSCGEMPIIDEDGDGSPAGEDPDDTDPCVPNQNVDACPNPPTEPTIPSFFNDFPWLANIVDTTDCEGEKITIYTSSSYTYIFVENGITSTLYNEQGTFYCQNGVGLNCLDFYTVEEIQEEWTCGKNNPPTEIDKDKDGTPATIDPDDNDPCVPDNTVTNCDEKPVEERPTIFIDYPWLFDYVDPTNCDGDSITVYRSGGFIYLLIQTNNSNILYNATGQQYCVNQANFNCQDFYKVDEIINVWSCKNTPVPPTNPDADMDGVPAGEDPDDNDPCVPNPIGDECESPPPTAAIFDDFPWLTDIINPTDCQGDSILHYTSVGYDYLLIITEDQPVGILYNGEGVKYCTSTATYDCTAFYTIDEVVTSWSCGTTPPPVENGDCANNTGNIRLTNCSNGEAYFFIEMPNGTIYDPYFSEGMTFDYFDGQTVNFDFEWADFASPCNFVQGAIILTCIEQSADCSCPDIDLPVCGEDGNTYSNACEANCAGVAIITESACDSNTPNFFADFPWLSDLVDINNCTTEKITVYRTASYNYIWIETPTGTTMYFEDGTFYCQQAENFNCLDYYQLDEIQYAWECTSFRNKTATNRSSLQNARTINKKAVSIPEFSVYPNPTTGLFSINISTLDQPAFLKIIDSRGNTIKHISSISTATSLEIDLTGIAKGIYFIQIQQAKGIHSQRLIISK